MDDETDNGNPVPNAQVIHKSLKILIEKNVARALPLFALNGWRDGWMIGRTTGTPCLMHK